MTPEEKLLRESKVIAVVGLSPNPERPSYLVAGYLKEKGYAIVPVNPGCAESAKISAAHATAGPQRQMRSRAPVRVPPLTPGSRSRSRRRPPGPGSSGAGAPESAREPVP